MPDTRQNQSNGVSITSNAPFDNNEEGMWKMKIEKKEGSKEDEVVGVVAIDQSTKYPDRPGEPDCIYYLRTGFCGYGSNCRFNHPPIADKSAESRSELPQREGQPDCGFYLKTGTCKYGSTCKYHHPLDKRVDEQVPLNTLGLPMRQEEKPCPYYMRTYMCKFGPACKFNHPQPASVQAALPTTTVGTMVSFLPSTGIPYISSSQVNGAQTYMPLVFPPLQGPLATQSWNGYVGNLSPLCASNMIGTNLVYNSKNQGELLTTNGQGDLSEMTISDLPERPDQPECRYFMTTGNCKYGLRCKFHHPKDKITPLAMSNLGPHGLPLRPGEDICAYFNSYGICKYGPICKFNHPFGGYFPGYYFSMPSMPMLNQPFLPNGKNSIISDSSETSQSKSSKITDWIQKPETVEDKKVKISVRKPVESPHEQVDIHQDATPTSSELPRRDLSD